MVGENDPTLQWDGHNPAYEWSAVNLVHSIGPDRVPESVFEQRTVRALQDDLEWVKVAVNQTIPWRPGYRLDFELLYGGEPNFQERESGVVQCNVHLDPPLAHGEERALFARRVYDGIYQEAPPYIWYGATAYAVRALSLAVQFDPEALPARAWWFENRPTHHLEGMTFVRENELSLNGLTRAIEHRFKSPSPERACGLAWEWPDGESLSEQ